MSPSPPPSPSRPTLSTKGRMTAYVVGGYAAFGTAWVLLSDQALLAVAPDIALLSTLGLWKGLAFVLLSSLVLYGLLLPREALTPTTTAPASPASAGRLLAVFALMSAVIVLAGVMGVSLLATNTRNNTLDKLQAVAQLKADTATFWIARRTSVHDLRQDTALFTLLREWRLSKSDDATQRLRAHLRALGLASGSVDALLLDANGDLLASGGELSSPTYAETRRTALAALAAHEVRNTGIYQEGALGPRTPHFDVAIPLAAPDPKDSAVLVLRADPRSGVLRLVAAWPGADAGEQAFLLMRHGETFVALGEADEHASPAATALAKALPGAAARAGTPSSRHVMEWMAPDQQPWLAVSVPVPNTPWLVAAGLPTASMQSALMRRALWVAVIELLALAACGSMLITLWQRRELRVAQLEHTQQHDKLQALQLLDDIANGSTDAIWAKDLEGRYTFVNDEICRVLCKPKDAVLGHDIADFFPPEQTARMRAGEQAVMRGGRVVQHEGPVTTPTGERFYMDTVGPLLSPAGQVIGLFGISRDITERKRREDVLRQWATAFASTRDGVMITDARKRIVAINSAFTQITGYTEDEVRGLTPTLLQSGRHDSAFYKTMRQALQAHGEWQGEIWNRRKNGETYPEWLTVRAVLDEAGTLTHYVGVFTDTTLAKHSEAQLERLAHYDPLTDLPNRQLIQMRLAQALAHAQRHGSRVAVMSIDIDRFKTINDSLGHPAGDELLVCVANRLKARLRAEDTLGRLGGDEFLVLLDSVGHPSEVTTLARDLLEAVAAPMALSGGQSMWVTASIGISLHPDDGTTTAVEMLRDADAAMYRAKDEGRNRFSFYTSDLNVDAVARLELEYALSRAIERQELQLYYQPKVDAATGRVVGAEALLRWLRPSGMVSPAQFIPVAEHSSLILDIGAWVIDQACAQLRAWIDAGLPVVPIAVNVAARQFAAGDLDVVVGQALQRHRVMASLLDVELTETMLMQQGPGHLVLLQRLKALGVKLSLDDFGTGYSSLGYLQRFPIDTLKIDQSFVRDIGKDDDGSVIVDAVIALAHRLHLRVVAEGVETEAQHAYLLSQGCDELQGYRFGRPGLPETLQQLLTAPTLPPE